MNKTSTFNLSALAIATALTALSSPAFAQKSGGGAPADGVITIDQNKALAGAVTPGDSAGFPVTITQNGTYRLASDLVVPAGVTGIYVANGVKAVIDMAGHAITGPATCSRTVNCYVQGAGGADGIDMGDNSSLDVSRGKIRGFTRSGIDGQSANTLVRATDMEVISNGYGIAATRLFATRIFAESNAELGIYGVMGTIVDSIASANRVGIGMGSGVVRGNTSYFNVYGYWLPAAVYQDNSATANNAVMMVTPQNPGSNNNF